MINNIFEVREVNHTPHHLPQTPEELSTLSEAFRGTYLQIKNHWGYTARISSLLEMIQYCYGIQEWELIELREVNNGDMQAKWMDSLLEYREGKDVDFGAIWEDLKSRLSFSISELNLIETGEIDQRLWAIFTVFISPNLPITYN